MRHYNSFDSKIQGQEFNAVSKAEYDEVMQLMAEENKASAAMPELEQQAWEVEDRAKDWLGSYSNIDNGASYNGIATGL